MKKDSRKQTQRKTKCLSLITNLFYPQQSTTAIASAYNPSDIGMTNSSNNSFNRYSDQI